MAPIIHGLWSLSPLIIFLSVTFGPSGAAVRPVVTFTPTWNRILYGDSVTMTCDVDDAVPGTLTYTWYRNNQRLHTGKTFTIQSARSRDGGNYQCGTSEDNISEVATLNVTRGSIVLQSPPYIYEGDDLLLRCHSGSKNTTGPIEYYRNNEMIHSSDTDSEFLVGNHSDVTAVYKCTKQVIIIDYGIHRDETDFSVQGAAASVMVTFSPNWRKILTGESMTMMCNGDQYGTYYWYKDNTLLKITDRNTMEIHSAQTSDSGTYQCGTSSGRSPAVRLDVILGPVILQAPLRVYEGHNIHLRCHSRPGYSVQWTKFYKDDKFLQDSGDGGLYLTQADVSGRYRCEKRLYRVSSYTDSVSVPIRELFSTPEIILTPSVVTVNDSMTLTCDTSPRRPTTELQFAFYRDGQEVQGFISSNKYEVPSTRLEDSGNYSCTGTTLDRTVWKTSQELHVQIPGGSQENRNIWLINIIRLITSGLMVIIAIVIVSHHIQSVGCRSQDVKRQEDTTELENITGQPL